MFFGLCVRPGLLALGVGLTKDFSQVQFCSCFLISSFLFMICFFALGVCVCVCGGGGGGGLNHALVCMFVFAADPLSSFGFRF